MTDRARELVERARRYRKDNLRETSIGYALFGELADFIEQTLTENARLRRRLKEFGCEEVVNVDEHIASLTPPEG